MGEADDGFESGTEITFNCIKGAAGERTTWKIICDDGVWSGRSYDCGKFVLYFILFAMILFCYPNNVYVFICIHKFYLYFIFKYTHTHIITYYIIDSDSLISANGTCIFWNNEPNVLSFYNDLQIREEVVEFPPGATIVSRSVLQY